MGLPKSVTLTSQFRHQLIHDAQTFMLVNMTIGFYCKPRNMKSISSHEPPMHRATTKVVSATVKFHLKQRLQLVMVIWIFTNIFKVQYIFYQWQIRYDLVYWTIHHITHWYTYHKCEKMNQRLHVTQKRPGRRCTCLHNNTTKQIW